jgi:hypothetical protein
MMMTTTTNAAPQSTRKDLAGIMVEVGFNINIVPRGYMVGFDR